MAERTITGVELMGSLPTVLEEIARRGTVFRVSLVSAAGEVVFVLGPPDDLGRVFGLVDEEYGWPQPIQLAQVTGAEDLMPGHRRHPVLRDGDRCLALSISLGEYEMLRDRLGEPARS